MVSVLCSLVWPCLLSLGHSISKFFIVFIQDSWAVKRALISLKHILFVLCSFLVILLFWQKRVSSERCAELTIIAATHGLKEVWISYQVLLLVYCLATEETVGDEKYYILGYLTVLHIHFSLWLCDIVSLNKKNLRYHMLKSAVSLVKHVMR